jgi:hypothetical protein
LKERKNKKKTFTSHHVVEWTFETTEKILIIYLFLSLKRQKETLIFISFFQHGYLFFQKKKKEEKQKKKYSCAIIQKNYIVLS